MSEINYIRTAAIIYGDESTVVKPLTIQKKIIESIFVENGNKRLDIHDIIDQLKSKLNLVFDETEINKIVNNEKWDDFIVQTDSKTEEQIINLSSQRYIHLKEKATKLSINQYLEEYCNKIYKGNLTPEKVDHVLCRFLYEVLNKNISAYKKITDPSFKVDQIAVDADLFTQEEREAINGFLNWNNSKKNKAIFILISYCLEYSLISNNVKNSKSFLEAFRNKVFYLDNNVIYRAIGINGEKRKRRILTFIDKCIKSGQTFKISKFTRKEFKDTIDHHVKQLQRVPFRRINPFIFKKYAVNPSIYEFYHNWRAGRNTYGFDLFNGHINGLYKNFIEKFKITEDYDIPFQEKDEKVQKEINNYKEEIRSHKGNGKDESHYFDAINTYLIESKRKNNKTHLTHTKYFFVSTDQKLRDWDFNRNDNQPIALLPSQWMGVLLKYFSRSDDDYKSFVSFLRLRSEEPMINEDKLQIVLAGISELTEDFESQSVVFERMVEKNFENILEQKNDKEIFEKSYSFAEKELGKEIKDLKSDRETRKEEFEKQSIEFKRQIYDEVKNSYNRLEKQKEPLDKIISKKLNRYKFIHIGLFLSIFIILFILILTQGWNKMEPYTFAFGVGNFIFNYVYTSIIGKSFKINDFFNKKEQNIRDKVYNKFNFDKEEFERLKKQKDTYENEINQLDEPA